MITDLRPFFFPNTGGTDENVNDLDPLVVNPDYEPYRHPDSVPPSTQQINEAVAQMQYDLDETIPALDHTTVPDVVKGDS